MPKFLPIISFPVIQKLNISIKDLVFNSNLQALTMQKVNELVEPDAIVGLMDLTVEAECFGSGINFFDDEVPCVSNKLVTSIQDAQTLKEPKVTEGRCQIYLEGISEVKKNINDKEIYGCCIGPYSLAGRLIGVTEAMMACYDEPEMLEIVLKKATNFLIKYINEYKKLGINGIVMAEPLAGVLSPVLAQKYSCSYVKEIITKCQDENFKIIYHNCGNNVLKMLDSILESGVKYLHIGNAVDLKKTLEKVSEDVVVMGNLDPVLLQNSTKEKIVEETTRILEEGKNYANFVLSTGCDVPPNASWDNILEFKNTYQKLNEHLR